MSGEQLHLQVKRNTNFMAPDLQLETHDQEGRRITKPVSRKSFVTGKVASDSDSMVALSVADGLVRSSSVFQWRASDEKKTYALNSNWLKRCHHTYKMCNRTYIISKWGLTKDWFICPMRLPPFFVVKIIGKRDIIPGFC